MKLNRIKLIGTRGDFEYSHEVHGEKFYKTYVEVKRISGAVDKIPVIVPSVFAQEDSRQVEIDGQIRTRNINGDDDKTHLEIYVFAKDLKDTDEEDCNYFVGEGYVCKDPRYRETPLGKNITDLLLAFNREYDKSDYIPCIAWGRNAHRVADCEIGTPLTIEGRLQSRKYMKAVDEYNEMWVEKTAYELSIMKVEEE